MKVSEDLSLWVGLTDEIYSLQGLSPRQKAERIIKYIKGCNGVKDCYTAGSIFDMVYLFSENCDLTWEQKDFVIYFTFILDAIQDAHSNVVNSTSTYSLIIDALKRWEIIDALELYNNDEKAGIKWFEMHKIPMQHVYGIINDKRLFGEIARKYPSLKSLPTKYLQYKCDECINDTGRVSIQQCNHLIELAVDLVKHGDYDKSHYDLLKVVGSEQIVYHVDSVKELANALNAQIKNIKTKEELLKYLDLRRDLGWIYYQWGNFGMPEQEYEQMLRLLEVEKSETDIRKFDLKNSKDIARCKELLPLAFDYPFLFEWWYDHDELGRIRYAAPKFVPDYDNGLEKKRKELHYKLATRGVLGRIASKTIVPKKLGKLGKKLEQKLANKLCRTRRSGRN